jgi:hypothetical protein
MQVRSTLSILAMFAAVSTQAQTIVPNAAMIATSKGDFLVPGRAFLDGRQPRSQPPVTAMTITLLQSATSTAPVCRVEHGTEVDLLEVQRDVEKKQYYFRVRAPKCDGWVPETALSTRKIAPIAGGGRK